MVGENSRCNHGHGKDWDCMLTTGNIACVGQCYLLLLALGESTHDLVFEVKLLAKSFYAWVWSPISSGLIGVGSGRKF